VREAALSKSFGLLAKARDRYGEDIFEAHFRKIMKICRKRGLVPPQRRVMTDATLIAADAALNSLVHNNPDAIKEFFKLHCALADLCFNLF